MASNSSRRASERERKRERECEIERESKRESERERERARERESESERPRMTVHQPPFEAQYQSGTGHSGNASDIIAEKQDRTWDNPRRAVRGGSRFCAEGDDVFELLEEVWVPFERACYLHGLGFGVHTHPCTTFIKAHEHIPQLLSSCESLFRLPSQLTDLLCKHL